jgi:hypothetical protein
MKLSLRGRYFASIPFLLLSLVLAARAQDKEWTWEDSSGTTRTRAELDEILKKHNEWVKSATKSGEQADLNDANLSGANLSGANLNGAKLNDANLIGANLSGAKLRGANLSGAYLNGAKLGRANLLRANLIGANLFAADLGGAFLFGADLSGADLRAADLNDARLRRANLSGAIYEPKEQPNEDSIAHARNLDLVTHEGNSKPLSDLRRSLREAGYRHAERQVTAALRRHDATFLETVFFDSTCEFGANAVRPLWIVILVWLVCTPIYWWRLHGGNRSGLYLLASGKKVNTGNEHLRVRRLRYHLPRRCRGYKYILRLAVREWHALSTATLFSLMSTFNIGFRELNFGRWIRMLQPREFDIKARGMLRVVSGLQSLLSVAMLALSLLSYFGRPFEI